MILNAISPLLPSCLASPFPQTWGIFSKSLQHCTAAAQEPGSCHSSTYCQIHINHIRIYKPVYCNVCACNSTLVFIQLGICTCLPLCMHTFLPILEFYPPHLRILKLHLRILKFHLRDYHVRYSKMGSLASIKFLILHHFPVDI